MGKILSCIALCFIIYNAHAQFANVSGRVIGKSDQQPLPGVSIVLDQSSMGTTADIDGNYSLAVPAGKHTLTFRMVGMLEKKVDVDLQENENKILIIMLEDISKELGVVVVSASKFEQKLEEVTVSMSVLKPSLAENANIVNMDRLLDQSPSVSIIDGQANIRGGSGWSYGAGSRVLLLVDDLPQLTADAGDVKWSFLPVENLEQVEVIKGASSALYGSSAMNGVINVRTAYPKSKPQTKINVYSGIYDTNQKIKLNDSTYNLNWNGKQPQNISGMNFLHSRQISNLDVVVGGSIFLDDGYRQGAFEKRGRINSNLRYRFKKIDGLSIGVNINVQLATGATFFIWQNDTTGAYLPSGGMADSTTTLSEYTTHRTNVDPYITYFTKRGAVHKLRTRYFRSNNENNTNQESKADLYYGEYQYQKKFSEKFTMTSGFVAMSSVVSSQLYTGDAEATGNHKGSNIAGYLQADAKLFKRLILSAGGRVEINKLDAHTDEATPVVRTGLNYRLAEQTHFRASYGQGYRYPSAAEKYIKTEISALVIYPNDSLGPEKSWSVEAGIMQGIRLGKWKGYFDLAGFYTRYHDMIEFTFSQWEQPYFDDEGAHLGVGFKALNVGETEIKGLDASLSGEGDMGPLNIKLLAGYTYMVPKQIEFAESYIEAVDGTLYPGAHMGSDSSNFLKYRYKHLVKGDLEIGFKKISVGISCRYNSVMKNVDQLFVDTVVYGPIITPGVNHYRKARKEGDAVVDVRCSFLLTKEVKLAFIVKNVFNYIYMQRPTDMQPPRFFTGQLTVAF
jgi:outer membrane cobalamin receptor